MSKWSENYKYKNPDITDIANNVSRIMGIDSGASGRRRDTMGNILTGAKTEGQQLKNIMLANKNQAFTQGINDPTLQNMFGKILGSMLSNPGSSNALALAIKTGKITPEAVREQKFKTTEQEHKTGKAGGQLERDQMVTTLAKNLMNRSDVDSPESRRIAQQLGTLRGDTRTGASVNLGMIQQEEKGAGFKTDMAETNLNIRKEVLNFLPKKQAEKLKNLENITKASEKKIKVQESKLETEKDRQELLEARTKQVRDLRAEKVLILKAKGEAQKAKNNSLVKELEAKQKELDLKIEVQEQKIKTEKTKGKTAESKLEKQELETKATPEILKKKLEKTGLEIKRLSEQLKGDISDSKRKKINADIAEETKQYKITLEEMKASEAKTKDTTATVKLNQLEEKYVTDKKILEQKLAKAQDDASRSKIQKEIEEKTKEFQIRKAELEATNLSTQIFKRMVDTPSPSEMDRNRRFKEAQISAKNKTGTSGVDNVEDFINKSLGKGDTTTSATTASPPPPKGMSPDPIAVEIFDRLMTTVEPKVLKSWTPEEVDKAVAMIQEEHPKMDETRIRRLIQTAQRRSQ